MRDLQTLRELASDECIECGEIFSESNPCCCDDSLVEVNGQELHLDGTCSRCCNSHFNRNISDGRVVAGGTFERGE